MKYHTLRFVKLGKKYKSNHGGIWFHIYFNNGSKSYRTALYENMRNFNNWKEIINKANRGDVVTNLRMKTYKEKDIIDADSQPILYTSEEWAQKESDRFEAYYGIGLL